MKIHKKYQLKSSVCGIPVQPYFVINYNYRNAFRGKFTVEIHHDVTATTSQKVQFSNWTATTSWFGRVKKNTNNIFTWKKLYRYNGTKERCPRSKVWWGDDEDT